jgi:hypothetical protein
VPQAARWEKMWLEISADLDELQLLAHERPHKINWT